MSLSKIAHFNWEKLLAKIENPDVRRSVNMLRGRANEITANSSKYAKGASPIDFAAYRKKLKFTGAAVDALEKAYKSKNLPTYTATLPSFEAKKRAVMMSVVQSTIEAAKADLEIQKQQLESFDNDRITADTSIGQLKERFPHLAKEIESEIKTHQWAKDSM